MYWQKKKPNTAEQEHSRRGGCRAVKRRLQRRQTADGRRTEEEAGARTQSEPTGSAEAERLKQPCCHKSGFSTFFVSFQSESSRMNEPHLPRPALPLSNLARPAPPASINCPPPPPTPPHPLFPTLSCSLSSQLRSWQSRARLQD